MLEQRLLTDEGILVISPHGRLTADDFQRVAATVDPWLESHGRLRGLLIDAPTFPGWADFAALLSHLRFVRDHQKSIDRVAAVADSKFLAIAPIIASHFVNAAVRHFPSAEREAALAWLKARRGEPA